MCKGMDGYAYLAPWHLKQVGIVTDEDIIEKIRSALDFGNHMLRSTRPRLVDHYM